MALVSYSGTKRWSKSATSMGVAIHRTKNGSGEVTPVIIEF
jgi:hypothetical protein